MGLSGLSGTCDTTLKTQADKMNKAFRAMKAPIKAHVPTRKYKQTMMKIVFNKQTVDACGQPNEYSIAEKYATKIVNKHGYSLQDVIDSSIDELRTKKKKQQAKDRAEKELKTTRAELEKKNAKDERKAKRKAEKSEKEKETAESEQYVVGSQLSYRIKKVSGKTYIHVKSVTSKINREVLMRIGFTKRYNKNGTLKYYGAVKTTERMDIVKDMKNTTAKYVEKPKKTTTTKKTTTPKATAPKKTTTPKATAPKKTTTPKATAPKKTGFVKSDMKKTSSMLERMKEKADKVGSNR